MIEQLIDQAPCGYFSFYDDGTLLQVNTTLATILKHESEALAGMNVETIFTLPTRIFFQTHFFPMIKMHGHAEEIFISLLSRDGEHIPVLLNAQRMEWKQRPITCCAFIVVNNRKKFEDELIAARKAAEKALQENTSLLKAKEALQVQAEKLEQQMRLVNSQHHEAKQFSHVVTHNLKEPLRKILLYSSKLQAESNSPVLDKLIRAADQMKVVVSGLQQYVWLNEKTNEFTHVDLDALVVKAANQVRSEQGNDILVLHCESLSSLEGDAEQIELLLYHLLSNAVKFRRGGAANVNISATILKQNTFRSVEEKYKYEDYMRLEIKDEGIGFESVYKEHIFELFRKLHFTEGQGVGLALCKKIIDNHSGHIDAESQINVFTKIIVWLPLKQA